MAFVAAIPRNVYPAGSRNVETPLTDGVREIAVRASRNAWQDTGTDIIEVTVELSVDDGATFQFLAGFKTVGGTLTDRLGNVITHSSMRVQLPTRGNFPLKIRVREANTVEIDTAIDFEVV